MQAVNGYYRHFLPIRNAILDRDGHRCQKCGANENLIVHHVDERGWAYFKQSYSVKQPIVNDSANLMTLCSSCHRKLHNRNRSKTKDVEQIMQLRQSGKTFQTIGDMLGVSRQRIHQVICEEMVQLD